MGSDFPDSVWNFLSNYYFVTLILIPFVIPALPPCHSCFSTCHSCLLSVIPASTLSVIPAVCKQESISKCLSLRGTKCRGNLSFL